MDAIDMTHWTPASTMIVVGALTTLAGSLAGAIISVVKAIKSGENIAHNAVNQMKDTVPTEAMHRMIDGLSSQKDTVSVQAPAAETVEVDVKPN